jgi:hypothetical protein
VLFAATTKELLQQALVNQRRGGAAVPLTEANGFVAARRRAPDAAVFLYVNCQVIWPVLATMLDRRVPSGAAGQASLMVSPATILRALGCDALGVFSLTVDVGERSTEAQAALTYTAERGLVKLFANMNGVAPRPRFVSPEWAIISTSRFSVKSAFETVEEILRNTSPPLAGVLQAQILNLNRQLGLDFKRDFFGSLGDEMISAYAPRGSDDPDAAELGQMDQLFAFSLNDRQAFAGAVEALKVQFGGGTESFVSRDYLGETIYTLNASASGAASRVFSYAITKRYFLVSIGSAGAIETVIRGLGGGQPSFWEEPALQAALASLPPGASGVVYHDWKKLVPGFFDGLVRLSRSAPAADDDDSDGRGGKAVGALVRLVDPSAKPSAESVARYWNYGIGATSREGNTLLSRYRVVYPP